MSDALTVACFLLTPPAAWLLFVVVFFVNRNEDGEP